MTTPTERNRATERERGGERTRDGEHGTIETGALAADWHVSRADGTTLVTVRVENTVARPRQVRVDNRLDGPVSPPRRRGVAERGWDDDGVTRTIPGGGTLSIGYACRAPAETPPVAVRDAPPEDDGESPVDRALRSLGDHAPPRAVLAADPEDGDRGSPGSGDGSDFNDGSGDGSDVDDERDASGAGIDFDATTDDASAEDDGPSAGSGEATHRPKNGTTTSVEPDDPSVTSVPTVVAAWFDAVEARVVTADRLSGDVHEATPVIASLGGRAGVETLAATLDGDAASLRRVADRAATLAEQVEGSEVPDVEVER